jgi:hypothetical protein
MQFSAEIEALLNAPDDEEPYCPPDDELLAMAELHLLKTKNTRAKEEMGNSKVTAHGHVIPTMPTRDAHIYGSTSTLQQNATSTNEQTSPTRSEEDSGTAPSADFTALNPTACVSHVGALTKNRLFKSQQAGQLPRHHTIRQSQSEKKLDKAEMDARVNGVLKQTRSQARMERSQRGPAGIRGPGSYSRGRMEKLACTGAGGWSEEDIAELNIQYQLVGGDWSEIAKRFEKRTALECCNQWRSSFSPEAQRERRRAANAAKRKVENEKRIKAKVDAKKREVKNAENKLESNAFEAKCAMFLRQSAAILDRAKDRCLKDQAETVIKVKGELQGFTAGLEDLQMIADKAKAMRPAEAKEAEDEARKKVEHELELFGAGAGAGRKVVKQKKPQWKRSKQPMIPADEDAEDAPMSTCRTAGKTKCSAAGGTRWNIDSHAQEAAGTPVARAMTPKGSAASTAPLETFENQKLGYLASVMAGQNRKESRQ